MVAAMPDTVHDALGEVAARDLADWFEGVMARSVVEPQEVEDLSRRFAGTETKLDAVDGRLTSVETKLDAVDGRLTEVETKLSAIDTRLGAVEHDLGDIRTELREQRREVTERFDRLYVHLTEQFDRVDDRLERAQIESSQQLERIYERMTSHMRWSVSLVAVFGTLVTILIALGQLSP